MTRSRRTGFARAALVVSALVSAELLAARLLLRADSARVWWRGTPFGASCAFNDHFGVPCPGCGFSRGVVLALQGDVTAAFTLFPVAPLIVLGLVALAFGLFGLAAAERCGADLGGVIRRLRGFGVAYVALLTLVWAAGYCARLSEHAAY